MVTALDKALKREIAVGGSAYTVVIDPEGIRLTRKGGRRPEAALRWTELVSGEAAMAVALNASLAARPVPDRTEVQSPGQVKAATPAARKRVTQRHR